MKAVIIYYSKTGHTLEAAKAIAEGLESIDAEVSILSSGDFSKALLSDCEIVIIGSPCWAGAFGFGGLASPISKMLKVLGSDTFSGKVCGGFSIHAANGGETTVKSLKKVMMQKGAELFLPGPVATAGTPMSVAKGKPIAESDLELYRNYGSSFTDAVS